MSVPVFADVDTGVDDAMALVYLLASTEARLVGIASTGGNVAVQQVCVNNLGLLELCRADDIPVSKGAEQPLAARSAHRRGHTRAARPRVRRGCHGVLAGSPTTTPPQAWVRAAHAYPGELVGLVTGPLTNLALALRLEPGLPRLLRRLVIMGGAFDYRGNTDAGGRVEHQRGPRGRRGGVRRWSAAGLGTEHLPIVLGLNLTEHVAMTPAILCRLAAGGRLGDHADERARRRGAPGRWRPTR